MRLDGFVTYSEDYIQEEDASKKRATREIHRSLFIFLPEAYESDEVS